MTIEPDAVTPRAQAVAPESPVEETGAPQAEPTPAPKTPFAAASKIVRHVQLAAIHFSACSAEALQDPTAADDQNLSLSASTKFLVPSITATEDGFSTKTTLLFQMEGKVKETDSGSLLAVIKATLEATYSFKADAPEFTDDDRKDFALCYCPFHVWGYWREFVQSSLARLDLPQMTIPLFLIAQAPQMVREKLD